MGQTRWSNCGLCGEFRITTREHVVPKSLYPASKANSRVQRIVIPACWDCNNGTADDDAHFRNVMIIAGEPNSAVKELWDGAGLRSLAQTDGHRRARDILKGVIHDADNPEATPKMNVEHDARVMKTIRKIVRGLSHFHGLGSPIADDQVFAMTTEPPFPQDLTASMTGCAVEPDIFSYRYLKADDGDALSLWHITIYERSDFFAYVSRV